MLPKEQNVKRRPSDHSILSLGATPKEPCTHKNEAGQIKYIMEKKI
jgi:hypothetical protein